MSDIWAVINFRFYVLSNHVQNAYLYSTVMSHYIHEKKLYSSVDPIFLRINFKKILFLES